jgi:gas vesicle protein
MIKIYNWEVFTMAILEVFEKAKRNRREAARKKAMKNVAVGAALGATIGAVAGVLLAPKAGKETREDITQVTKEAVEKAKGKMEEVKEKAGAVVEEVKTKVKKKIEKSGIEEPEATAAIAEISVEEKKE